jgi:hypothetical protein
MRGQTGRSTWDLLVFSTPTRAAEFFRCRVTMLNKTQSALFEKKFEARIVARIRSTQMTHF